MNAHDTACTNADGTNANAWTDRHRDRDEARAVTIGWRDCLTSHDPWVMYINPSDTPLDRHRHL